MNIDDVRATIEQHVCVMGRVPYRFRLEWWATEKDVERPSGRILLEIECIRTAVADSHKDYVPLNVVVWLLAIFEASFRMRCRPVT